MKELIAEMKPVIKEAGSILLKHFRKSMERVEKENGQGFVTPADVESEQYLINSLRKIFPQASFWAEESGKSGSEGDYCWVIDPLDGTTNYGYTIPYFSVSIALTFKNEPVLSMVYDPLTQDLFFAIKGMGSFLNDQPIKVSSINELNKSLLLLSVPYDKDNSRYDKLMECSMYLAKNCYALRQLGSVALDMAYVACGRADATFFADLEWWDIAAGVLLVQEAGGLVTNFKGNKLTYDMKECVAANPYLHKTVQNSFITF